MNRSRQSNRFADKSQNSLLIQYYLGVTQLPFFLGCRRFNQSSVKFLKQYPSTDCNGESEENDIGFTFGYGFADWAAKGSDMHLMGKGFRFTYTTSANDTSAVRLPLE